MQAHRVGRTLRRIIYNNWGKGVYTLIISIKFPLRLRVGRLGSLSFPKGLYLYTGSALGPGGLERRVDRHLRGGGQKFWHIDHLLGSKGASVGLAIIAQTGKRMECRINRSLETVCKTHAKGFGSSDCIGSCASHLLRSETHSVAVLRNMIFDVYRKSGLRPLYRFTRHNRSTATCKPK